VSELLTVLNPTGYPPTVKAKGLAPAVGELDGKTVFLVDVGFENSDHFMVQLQPKMRTEVVRWKDQQRPDPELCEQIRAEGDAAILGVGL
jgi:hypothetical protein